VQVQQRRPTRPRFRGRLHEIAFFVSIPAGIALVNAGHRAAAYVGAAIFAVSLSAAYGTSAAYHLRSWSPRAERVMKHLDHSMIFVLIAGSFTPIALLALRPSWSVAMVSIAWTGALMGVGLDHLNRAGLVLYLALGWLPIVAAAELVRGLTFGQLALLLAGGVVYTAGAAMLAAKRPRLRPATFGYHEFWHAMVVGGGACHYALILLLVRA
jgi:hemolysin III